MRHRLKFAIVFSSWLALLVCAPGAQQSVSAQVAASSSQANPYSSNLNSNSNSSTVYNVLPNPQQSHSETSVLSLTLSLGWSNTYVYPAAPTTCPVAIRSSDVLTTRIPLGCPIPAVLNTNVVPTK